ncbi:hypothetical protein ACSSS7_004270 [Eimeria intestinalis]
MVQMQREQQDEEEQQSDAVVSCQPQAAPPPQRPGLSFTHPKASSMVIASVRQQANPILKVLPAVNRADVVSLAKEFGCMRSILLAQQRQLQQCPGIGPKKVRSLLAAFHEPFFAETDVTASAGSSSLCTLNIGHEEGYALSSNSGDVSAMLARAPDH